MNDSLYWHFYENYNPSFCPARKQPQDGNHFTGSADDRFKGVIGCMRPCSCQECRQQNIDKNTKVHIFLDDKIREFLFYHSGALLFLRWIISGVLLTLSMSQTFMTFEGAFNFLWYQSPWLWVFLPSVTIFALSTAEILIIYSAGTP